MGLTRPNPGYLTEEEEAAENAANAAESAAARGDIASATATAGSPAPAGVPQINVFPTAKDPAAANPGPRPPSPGNYPSFSDPVKTVSGILQQWRHEGILPQLNPQGWQYSEGISPAYQGERDRVALMPDWQQYTQGARGDQAQSRASQIGALQMLLPYATGEQSVARQQAALDRESLAQQIASQTAGRRYDPMAVYGGQMGLSSGAAKLGAQAQINAAQERQQAIAALMGGANQLRGADISQFGQETAQEKALRDWQVQQDQLQQAWQKLGLGEKAAGLATEQDWQKLQEAQSQWNLTNALRAQGVDLGSQTDWGSVAGGAMSALGALAAMFSDERVKLIDHEHCPYCDARSKDIVHSGAECKQILGDENASPEALAAAKAGTWNQGTVQAQQGSWTQPQWQGSTPTGYSPYSGGSGTGATWQGPTPTAQSPYSMPTWQGPTPTAKPASSADQMPVWQGPTPTAQLPGSAPHPCPLCGYVHYPANSQKGVYGHTGIDKSTPPQVIGGTPPSAQAPATQPAATQPAQPAPAPTFQGPTPTAQTFTPAAPSIPTSVTASATPAPAPTTPTLPAPASSYAPTLPPPAYTPSPAPAPAPAPAPTWSLPPAPAQTFTPTPAPTWTAPVPVAQTFTPTFTGDIRPMLEPAPTLAQPVTTAVPFTPAPTGVTTRMPVATDLTINPGSLVETLPEPIPRLSLYPLRDTRTVLSDQICKEILGDENASPAELMAVLKAQSPTPGFVPTPPRTVPSSMMAAPRSPAPDMGMSIIPPTGWPSKLPASPPPRTWGGTTVLGARAPQTRVDTFPGMQSPESREAAASIVADRAAASSPAASAYRKARARRLEAAKREVAPAQEIGGVDTSYKPIEGGPPGSPDAKLEGSFAEDQAKANETKAEVKTALQDLGLDPAKMEQIGAQLGGQGAGLMAAGPMAPNLGATIGGASAGPAATPSMSPPNTNQWETPDAGSASEGEGGWMTPARAAAMGQIGKGIGGIVSGFTKPHTFQEINSLPPMQFGTGPMSYVASALLSDARAKQQAYERGRDEGIGMMARERMARLPEGPREGSFLGDSAPVRVTLPTGPNSTETMTLPEAMRGKSAQYIPGEGWQELQPIEDDAEALARKWVLRNNRLNVPAGRMPAPDAGMGTDETAFDAPTDRAREQHDLERDMAPGLGLTVRRSPDPAATGASIDDMLGKIKATRFRYKPGFSAMYGSDPRTGVIAQDVASSRLGSEMTFRDPSTGLLALDFRPDKWNPLVLASLARLSHRIDEMGG